MNDTTQDTQSTQAADDTISSKLTYGDWNLLATDLPPKAVYYLLQNGYSQSMSDAGAITKETQGKVHEDFAKAHGVGVDTLTADHKTAAVAAFIKQRRQARHDAILKGEVGAKVGGPRLDPLTRAMHDIAKESLDNLAKSRGKAPLKGDQLKAGIEKILAVRGNDIRKAAEDRLAQAQAFADVGDDLFAGDDTASPAA